MIIIKMMEQKKKNCVKKQKEYINKVDINDINIEEMKKLFIEKCNNKSYIFIGGGHYYCTNYDGDCCLEWPSINKLNSIEFWKKFITKRN